MEVSRSWRTDLWNLVLTLGWFLEPLPLACDPKTRRKQRRWVGKRRRKYRRYKGKQRKHMDNELEWGIQLGGTHVAHWLPWHDPGSERCQRARKMPSPKYPQSHSLTAYSCRWQALITSDPLAKGNAQAGGQHSPCLFTLLFWAPWRGTAAKPYLGISSREDRMRAGGVIYAQGKGTPAHEVSAYKSRGSTGTTHLKSLSWLHPERATGSSDNNHIKQACRIMA